MMAGENTHNLRIEFLNKMKTKDIMVPALGHISHTTT